MVIADLKNKVLKVLGFSGAVQDQEFKFFKSEGVSSKTYPEAFMEWLSGLGFGRGSLQDRLKEYLSFLGFTGAIQDAEEKALANGIFYDTIPLRVKNILSKYNATLLLPGPDGTVSYWFQPNNYRESTGQTLASVDQQVGLVVDAARVPGPELVSNPGPFANTTGWVADGGTLSAAGGALVITSSGAGYAARAGVTISTTADRTYEVVVVAGASAASPAVRVGSTYGGSQLFPITGFSQNSTYRFVFRATGSLSYLAVAGSSVAGATSAFSAISVRELPGIHASQSTSGFQPYLRRGLLNQLLWSSDFSNAAWATTGSSKVGNKLVEDTSTATHIVVRSTSGTNGEAVTLAAVIEAAGRNYAHISISGATHAATINLTNGEVNAATGSPIQISSVNLGSGKWLLSLSGAYSTVVNQCNFYTSADGVWANRSYTGDGASGIVMHSAAFFQGTATADQIIAAGGIPVTTTAPASSANGVQFWQFDGTDDRLSLSAVPFQMSDDHFVVIGARQASAGVRCLFGQGTTNATANQPFFGFNSLNELNVYVRNDAGLAQQIKGPAIAANVIGVYSYLRRSTGALTKIKVDGVDVASSNASLPTSVASSAGVGSNMRPTPAEHFNGHIHCVILGKGAITDAELLVLEKFAASLQGRSL